MATILKYNNTEIYTLNYEGQEALTANYGGVRVFTKRYKLTGQYNHIGATVLISRTSSPNGLASIGNIYPSAGALYHGDAISFNVSLLEGYGNAKLTINGTQHTSFPVSLTVTQDITFSLSYEQIGEIWHDMWSGWVFLGASNIGSTGADYVYYDFGLLDNIPTRVYGSVADWLPACSGGYLHELEGLDATGLPYTSDYLDAEAAPHLYQQDSGLYGWNEESVNEWNIPTWGRGCHIASIQQKYF